MSSQSPTGIGCFAPLCQKEFVAVGNDTIVNCPVAFCEEHVGEWSEKDNIEITGERSIAPGTDHLDGGEP